MQGFVMRVNPLLNALSRSGLKQPVNGGGGVEDDHRRSPVIGHPSSDLRSSFVRSSCPFFLHQAGSIEWDGDGFALMQTRAELGQSWPLCDLFNLCEQIV